MITYTLKMMYIGFHLRFRADTVIPLAAVPIAALQEPACFVCGYASLVEEVEVVVRVAPA